MKDRFIKIAHSRTFLSKSYFASHLKITYNSWKVKKATYELETYTYMLVATSNANVSL